MALVGAGDEGQEAAAADLREAVQRMPERRVAGAGGGEGDEGGDSEADRATPTGARHVAAGADQRQTKGQQ
ncbi:hypothetical protein A4X03_0g5665 [Tilletia caries]|uniref:Uncharacterized protein n=1 Tax=Tilletia caries TaxID=13290 RepID=A0A8T8T4K9_9BASI|nr:hypothetical protein A4X03_0g5665 [Tilletia caries]